LFYNLLLQVAATKAAMEVSVARVNMQKNAYLQYRDMALFDRQLDLEDLAPAFKETCGLHAAVAALLDKVPGGWVKQDQD
jgi:hypothetical protein